MEAFIKFGIGVVAVAALVLGVFALNHSQPQPPAGATTGPDSFYPCETRNGVQRCFNQIGFATATTTVCAIKSPVNATSTLVSGGVTFRTSSTTASTVTFARATTAFATTTAIGSQIAIAAGAQITATASTTSTTGGSTIFSQGTFFVVGMQGNGGTNTFSPVGTCNATFEVLQ